MVLQLLRRAQLGLASLTKDQVQTPLLQTTLTVAHNQRSEFGFFFVLAASSTILRIASARDGRSI